METQKDMTSGKEENVEVLGAEENTEKSKAGELKSELVKTDSTFNVEEYSALKEKVEKLEGLLAKCRGTIVNNKEKVKRLSEDKEGIQHKFEHQLELIKKQYEEEMNSKFSSLQEQINSLTEAKDRLQSELEAMLELKGDELLSALRGKHEEERLLMDGKIKCLTEELQNAKGNKTQQETSTTTTTTTAIATDASTTEGATTTAPSSIPECVKVEPEEHKKVLKQLEARSEELIGVMEERTSLRKELVSQRDRFSLVLERYDSQMKVVQEELRLRMMPGPVQSSVAERVASIMDEAFVHEASNGEGSEKCAEKPVGDKTKCGKSIEKRLEDSEARVVKLLLLLEECAKKIDDREAECARWNARFSELSDKHSKASVEAEESIKRLEKQVSEMAMKENALNEELEKTRNENGDMLRAQRSEMGELQKVVDRLVANEEFLKTQMGDIEAQCDGEVARANIENEKAMSKLKGMFEDNKKAVGELFEQLNQSKEKSNEVVKEFESELDYRYRQLEAARTYITCLNEGKTPPMEPSLEAIFSNLPNFIYVDDVVNGDADKKSSEAVKIDGVMKEKADAEKDGNCEKSEDVSEKSMKSNAKPTKANKK